jgi:hypothetical protein
MLAGPLPGIYDPTGPGKLLFAFFAAMAETERENIRESTLEGIDTAACKGKHGGRPPVITDDMLHTVLRRRAGGESVEQIQPDLIIPTGKRKGHTPSVASIYRALAEHAKREAYSEAVEQAHADFAALQARCRSRAPYRSRGRDDGLTTTAPCRRAGDQGAVTTRVPARGPEEAAGTARPRGGNANGQVRRRRPCDGYAIRWPYPTPGTARPDGQREVPAQDHDQSQRYILYRNYSDP